MSAWFLALSPVAQGTLAGVVTWLLTALGAIPVLLFTHAPRRLMDALMGFAGGVMVAASCWSLLVPAIDAGGIWRSAVGLLAGAALMFGVDQLLPHLHPEFPDEARREGPPVPWRRSALLLSAITLHNFPEGLAVGVGYGGRDVGAATALAIGIGLQNLPEGLAIALPLRREGLSRAKALWYGQLSGVVEPFAALVGALVVTRAQVLLPYGMALAAGAMLYVVVEELIPETVRSGTPDVATIAGQPMPDFWTGVVLLTVFAVVLPVLPASGFTTWGGLVLPAVTVAILQIALISRLVRRELGTALAAPYLVVARSRGVSERALVWRYGMGNSFIPVLTAIFHVRAPYPEDPRRRARADADARKETS